MVTETHNLVHFYVIASCVLLVFSLTKLMLTRKDNKQVHFSNMLVTIVTCHSRKNIGGVNNGNFGSLTGLLL